MLTHKTLLALSLAATIFTPLPILAIDSDKDGLDDLQARNAVESLSAHNGLCATDGTLIDDFSSQVTVHQLFEKDISNRPTWWNQDAVYPLDASVSLDTDNDGVDDNSDNCPGVSNDNQSDLDADGDGDACDVDDDGDGLNDAIDVFPLDQNEQTDTDGDGIGDNSDPSPEEAAPLARQFLQTTSSSQNVTSLHVINSSDANQSFVGSLYSGNGDQLGKRAVSLGTIVSPGGRIILSSETLESIFGVSAWKGPAMLEVTGEAQFALMSRLISPSDLVSNTNCVRQDRVMNIEGFDSANMTFVRFINTTDTAMSNIKGTLYDKNGNVIGNANSLLLTSLGPKEQVWINRNTFATKVDAEWNAEAMLEVDQVDGLRLLNLNFVNGETFFNFSCFEDSASGTVYLQTNSDSQNISFTHVVNTSDTAQQFTGTLFSGSGERLGAASQALHTGMVPAKGRLILASEDLEAAFSVSAWRGPAMLEVQGSDTFELMTKLTSPSGLISNTNCVRMNQVHNIVGFDSPDVTYIRFINTGNSTLSNIKGTLYDGNGNAIGSASQVLIASLAPKQQIWVNRNDLSDLVGDTWNGEATLKVESAPEAMRLLNLNFINSETFFNFSCYETGEPSRASQLYVVNLNAATVSIVDLSTDKITRTITTGTQPGHIVHSPTSSKNFLADLGESNIKSISTASQEVTNTITISRPMGGLDINTETNKIYALDLSGETLETKGTNIHVINASTELEELDISIGTDVQDIRVDSSTDVAYISDFSEGVILFNTSTNTKSGTITLANAPHGLAIDPIANLLYVTTIENNSVAVINTMTNSVISTIAVGATPQWIVLLDDSSKAYVTNEGDGTVSVIDTNTGTVTKTLSVGTSPFYLVTDVDTDKVYVSNPGSDSVSVIDTSTDTVVGTISVGDGPGGLVIVP